jgi:hypothetical protein
MGYRTRDLPVCSIVLYPLRYRVIYVRYLPYLCLTQFRDVYTIYTEQFLSSETSNNTYRHWYIVSVCIQLWLVFQHQSTS